MPTKATKPQDDVYVSAPLTPNDVALQEPSQHKPKLSHAERYAREPPFRMRANPLESASLLSVIFTHWLQPLVSLGAHKVLEQQDLWRVCHTDTCDALEARFQQHYTGDTGMGMALAKTFFRETALVFANYTVYLLAMVLQPFLSMAILDFLNDRENVFHISNGYILVALMGGVSFVGVTCLNYGVFVLSRSGANMRSVVMNAVYQKALTLSSSARQAYTTGEIMTLMSVDTERIFHANLSGLWLFFAPLAFVVTIALVAAFFDIFAAICGAVLLTAVLTASVKLAARIGRTQSALLRIVEERVKVTSEALQGIRVMKFYAWEESLARRVESIRAREVQMFRKFHFLSIVNSALLFLTPVLLGAVTLGVFLARQGTMTVTDAFTLIAMVNISRLGVSMFPVAIASVSQARIAFRRMDKYMASEELAVLPALPGPAPEREQGDRRGSILASTATFVWSDKTDAPQVVVTDGNSTQNEASMHGRFMLEGVNVEIDAGSLVMVVGTVGAGKSSLLHALLGEMKRTGGTCAVHGEIAYVSQEAWIRNSTVKDNILFESPLDADRYEEVLEATQLALDLHALPDGDQTEIGERGINLSGGQKARVAIARAMYRWDYDILMLDDPLSAVDPHVAHAIFHQCIAGLASSKTRVLVLNSHYDLLTHADKILVVDQGKIVGDGVYKDVIAQFPSLDIHRHELEAQEKDTIDEHADATPTTAVEEATETSTQSTDASVDPPASEKKVSDGTATKLVQDEDRVKGKVSANTYRTYFDETGFNGIAVVVGVVTMYAAAQGMRITADYWQGYWAKQMPRKEQSDPTYSDVVYAWWYVGFIVSCAVLTFARGLVLIDMCMRTARNLHDGLFRRVLRAPVNVYFDVTPVGRILNRFSNDLDQVDANLPQQYQGMFESLAAFFGSLVVCTFASAYIAASYVPMLGVFVLTGLYFKRSSRELKRLEGVTRTPIFSLFDETLHGLATIRAFKMQRAFIAKNKQAVDQNASYYFHFWAAGRWLAVRLDWLSALVILIVSLYIVSAKGTIAPVIAGLSITYSLTLTSMVQWCVRSVDMTDNAMTSVERLLAFRDIPQEEEAGVHIHDAAWPTQGAIHFDQLCLRYRPALPLVLRGVNMKIDGGEKVGICGRTGAGKSSLMIALFRICEFDSGTVRIDGVDIATLALQDLRRALAIIPQDPVLYSGSLRDNLDPFHQYSDDAIWRVLRQVHLADAMTWGGSGGLDFVVSERGDNLSVGQRQLLCIGRALLKDSKIVVLDEATANVDSATDALIQTTIRATFATKTVLIIAHRIHTILHCHKIAVMDAGRVAEFGAPSELLSQPESIFAALANRAAANQAQDE